MKKEIDNQTVSFNGFNIFRADRAGKRGGVAVYVKSSLSVLVPTSVSIPKYFEFIS